MLQTLASSKHAHKYKRVEYVRSTQFLLAVHRHSSFVPTFLLFLLIVPWEFLVMESNFVPQSLQKYSALVLSKWPCFTCFTTMFALEEFYIIKDIVTYDPLQFTVELLTSYEAELHSHANTLVFTCIPCSLHFLAGYFFLVYAKLWWWETNLSD